jgi:hypothetical protein
MAVMGRRVDPRELAGQDGPELFEFLLDAGFVGPETTEGGLAYHRPGLHIDIHLYTGREPELVTSIRHQPADGTPARSASLDCLYIACRCGVLQDVAGSAPNLRTTAKRLRQHAQALRRVLPHLLTDDAGRLIARCQGRLLPDP